MQAVGTELMSGADQVAQSLHSDFWDQYVVDRKEKLREIDASHAIDNCFSLFHQKGASESSAVKILQA